MSGSTPSQWSALIPPNEPSGHAAGAESTRFAWYVVGSWPSMPREQRGGERDQDQQGDDHGRRRRRSAVRAAAARTEEAPEAGACTAPASLTSRASAMVT